MMNGESGDGVLACVKWNENERLICSRLVLCHLLRLFLIKKY